MIRLRKFLGALALASVALGSLAGCHAVEAANETVQENLEPITQRQEADVIERSAGIKMTAQHLPSHQGTDAAYLICADDFAIIQFRESGATALSSAAVRMPELDDRCDQE